MRKYRFTVLVFILMNLLNIASAQIIANNVKNINGITDGAGGAIIFYKIGENFNDKGTYLQFIRSNGDLENPIFIDTSTISEKIASDNKGGAIISWSKFIGKDDQGNFIYHEFINFVDSNGNLRFPKHQQIFGFASSLFIASDGKDGAIIAWSDFENGEEITRINFLKSDGSFKFPKHNTIQGRAVGIASDGNDGAIILLYKDLVVSYNVIYSTGDLMYDDDNVFLSSSVWPIIKIMPHGKDVAIGAYKSSPGIFFPPDIYIIFIDSLGGVINPIIKFQGTENSFEPKNDFSIDSDNLDGGIIIKNEHNKQGIFVNFFKEDGTIKFDTPLKISDNGGSPIAVSNGNGDFIIFYIVEEFRKASSLYVKFLSKNGDTKDFVKFKFIRGDADGSKDVDMSDAIFVLLHLFRGSEAPKCLDAADFDDSGVIDVTDPIYLLRHLFLGETAPPFPYRDANGNLIQGEDPTQDTLDCECYGPTC